MIVSNILQDQLYTVPFNIWILVYNNDLNEIPPSI